MKFEEILDIIPHINDVECGSVADAVGMTAVVADLKKTFDDYIHGEGITSEIDIKDKFEFLISKIHEMDEIITKEGIENYLIRTCKQGEDYIPIAERDMIFNADLEEKPANIWGIISNRKFDYNLEKQKVFEAEMCNKEVKVAYLDEKVGFDACCFNINIKSFDMNKFILSCQKIDNCDGIFPMVNTSLIDELSELEPMILPGVDEHKYKKIEIKLSPYICFYFAKNNSMLNGKKNSDIYQVQTRVVPSEKAMELGNINNNSVYDVQEAIIEACDELKDIFGIEVDPKQSILSKVELNLTFEMCEEFKYLRRNLEYALTNSCCGYSVHKYYNPLKDNKKKSLENKGFEIKCDSVKLKLYDKKYETEMNGDLKIANKSLVRVEFVIHRHKQIRTYFGAYSIYLFELSQKDLEAVFKSLINKFFVKSYKRYAKTSIDMLKEIVKTIDFRNNTWQKELIRSVLSEALECNSTPAMLEETDLIDIIKKNKTAKKNLDTIIPEMLAILRETDFRSGQKDAYNVLGNFILKSYLSQNLSHNRKIYYILNDE